MPTLWTCPDCKTLNKASAKACDSCGRDRIVPAADKPSASTDDWRCTWIEDGRRCYMAGGIGAKSPRCTWHSYAADHPRLRESYDEFERWVLGLLEAKYCCDWTHDRAHELWQAVRGIAALPPFPSACLQTACRYAEERETGRTKAIRAVQQALEMAAGGPKPSVRSG